MLKAILGTKVGMTQIFTEEGKLIPVTVIEAGPCVVTQKKTVESDGYTALQLGYGEIRQKLVNKPIAGVYKKAGVPVKRFLREFRIDDVAQYEVGQELKADVLEVGEAVDVTGTSRGRGFKGVIARWGQHRGPMAHGSRYHRRPGSMGACSSPSRVFKGKRLPGHFGDQTVTVQNLEVIRVEADRNLLIVKGAVPGANGGLVAVKKSVKA